MRKRRKKRKRSQSEQLTFGEAMGIRRKGAGRKKDPNSGVSHLKREAVSKHVPLHVNSHLVDDLPSLRTEECEEVILGAIRVQRERAGQRDDGEFFIVEYSIQDSHIHLIVEAGDADALARGMAGLKVRIARGLNKLWGRTGQVWSDRYFARALRTPREVYNALRYVFHNARKHGRKLLRMLPDPFSSGVWFEGWDMYDHRYDPQVTAERPTARARSWLLRIGWLKHHGYLSVW